MVHVDLNINGAEIQHDHTILILVNLEYLRCSHEYGTVFCIEDRQHK